MTELAQLTGLPLSTTHRLVGDLACSQLLRRRSDGLYEVGPNLQRLAGDVASVPTLDDRAPLAVTDLFEVTRRRTRLGVLCDDRVLYVERRTLAGAPTRFSADASLPAHATALGKALLAFAPRERVASVSRNLVAYTPQTLTQPERLHRELRLARLVGIALGRGELAPGDSAIAAPVFALGVGSSRLSKSRFGTCATTSGCAARPSLWPHAACRESCRCRAAEAAAPSGVCVHRCSCSLPPTENWLTAGSARGVAVPDRRARLRSAGGHGLVAGSRA